MSLVATGLTFGQAMGLAGLSGGMNASSSLLSSAYSDYRNRMNTKKSYKYWKWQQKKWLNEYLPQELSIRADNDRFYAQNSAKWAVDGLRRANLNPVLAAQSLGSIQTSPSGTSSSGGSSPDIAPASPPDLSFDAVGALKAIDGIQAYRAQNSASAAKSRNDLLEEKIRRSFLESDEGKAFIRSKLKNEGTTGDVTQEIMKKLVPLIESNPHSASSVDKQKKALGWMERLQMSLDQVRKEHDEAKHKQSSSKSEKPARVYYTPPDRDSIRRHNFIITR